MKNLFLINFYFACVLLFFLSCGNNLNEGKIINKFYEPKRIYSVMEFNPALKMSMVKIKCDDEDYVFIIENKHKGSTIAERFEVSKDVYNLFIKGDWWVKI